MDWHEKYKDKLISMEEAVTKIHSGDVLTANMATGIPYAYLNALAMYSVEHLKDVTLYMGGGFKKCIIGAPQFNGHVDVKNFFFGPLERKLVGMGSNMSYQPIHLSRTTIDRQAQHIPNVLVVAGTAPDENGLISTGPAACDTQLLDICDTVIVQVNNTIPFVYGTDTMLPADRVTWMVEADEQIPILDEIVPTETEEKMAQYIVEQIPDGACIQLGIGGTARAVGQFLKDKKHLGCHTEMFTSTLSALMESGVIDNSQKTLLPGKTVIGFSLGTNDMYRFMDHNPNIESRPFRWVNDPYVIAQNDNMMSINGAIQVDLTGQVCAESIGPKQYSGTGGQADYVRGARMSKGGKSFLALPSTLTKSDGSVISKISLWLPQGSVVTTLRTDVQYIVTEYGIANLRDEPVDVRAKRLIAIAHPDFRDQLTFEAKKAGLIV